jgi:hypothetical protein
MPGVDRRVDLNLIWPSPSICGPVAALQLGKLTPYPEIIAPFIRSYHWDSLQVSLLNISEIALIGHGGG